MPDQAGSASNVRDLTPQEVAQRPAGRPHRAGRCARAERDRARAFPGAVLVPLSAFDPAAIPDPQGREVVFACRSGRRSVTASLAAQEQGFAYGSHLAGGILAWKAAGLPTET